MHAATVKFSTYAKKKQTSLQGKIELNFKIDANRYSDNKIIYQKQKNRADKLPDNVRICKHTKINGRIMAE